MTTPYMDQQFGDCMVHEGKKKNVFSDDLGNLGIILGSHRTPVFEMSS
jgi:hypothetical protein